MLMLSPLCLGTQFDCVPHHNWLLSHINQCRVSKKKSAPRKARFSFYLSVLSMIDKSDLGSSAVIYQNSSQSSPLLLGAGVLGLPVGESAPPPPGDFMRAGAALLTGAGTLDVDAGADG
jgi:hypothetical protein